ncbi:MAG: sensor histidine kinase [Cytophagales bacterium]|nr:sensor histidine kinase [Cytophagales bacterium]
MLKNLIIFVLKNFYFFLSILSLENNLHGQGVLDLRGQNAFQTVDLQTQWQFYYGAFLTAGEMQVLTGKVYFDMPSTWAGNNWAGEIMPGYGHATYYLRVQLDPAMSELAMKVPPMGTASRLIVNGEFIGEVGTVGDSEHSSIPKYRDVIYHLPHHEGTIDIVFHISNFHYRKGGLWQIPVLGTVEAIYKDKTAKYQLEFIVFGTILFMGLYHLGLYLYQFRSPLIVTFGLICFIMALRAASVGQYVLTDIFPNIPWGLLVKIEFISYFMVVALMAIFIRELFKDHLPMIATWIIAGTFIGASLFTIAVPIWISSHLIPFIQWATILSAVYIFYVLFKAALEKNREAVIFMVGIFILTTTLINDMLFYNNLITTGSYFAIGLGLYFFTHAMILARRFSYAFLEVKRLSYELQESNTTLEKKVYERTRQIETQNEQLTLKNEQLQKLDQEKDALISVIAHDLKAPFNRAKSLLALIKASGPLTKDQENITSMIHQSTDQGHELISDLLLLYGEKQVTHKKKKIDLEQLVAETGKVYKELATQKEITLHLQTPGTPVELTTDPHLLSRALDNLLTNAIKFTEHHKNIYLALTCDSRYVSIAVIDEGPGIPMEEHGLLFKKLQKLTPKPTDGESSTGLGLSIVKQLIEELSGSVEVESELGKGSTFTLKLPMDC